ncbi:hypothetical protein [Kitasatospora sp. HPMI-4]|uniref:hypothetical protein n=1 Tax=Kitasatospora sp. HPMI-4 TaxID=3448443 RepID=UPI003F1A2EF2
MFRTSVAQDAGRARRTGLALAAAGLALAALGSTAPASATGPADPDGTAGRPARLAAVSGSARIFYTFSPDDEIWFSFDAVAAPFTRRFPGVPKLEDGLPTDARGTVHFSHHVAASNTTYRAEAAVDCLVTGDRVASLTAVITSSDMGNTGERVGFSVYDGGGNDRHGHSKDRLGFSWGVANLDVDATGKPVQPVVGTCMAPAPFAPVVQGGFTVRHAELLNSPTAS